MRRIRFQVEGGLPPRKQRNRSVWEKEQASRTRALRKEAHKKLGSEGCFTGRVQLKLEVHVQGEGNRDSRLGDLDNFVSGICDALGKWDPKWGAVDPDVWPEAQDCPVHPERPIAFDDDSQVMKIDAEKWVWKNSGNCYEVVLEGE